MTPAELASLPGSPSDLLLSQAEIHGMCELHIEGSVDVGCAVEIDNRGGPCKITIPSAGRLVLGNFVFVNFGLDLFAQELVQIGDYTMIAPRVFITDDGGHRVGPGEAVKRGPVEIGRNCWLGHSCCILPGVSIGENSVVGAGSVVTRSIPANVVAVGVPARPIRRITAKPGWIRNAEVAQ